MKKYTNSKILSDSLELTTSKSGIWLYDTTQGMYLSMRAVDEVTALTEAITYYQEKVGEVMRDYDRLDKIVRAFLSELPCEFAH